MKHKKMLQNAITAPLLGNRKQKRAWFTFKTRLFFVVIRAPFHYKVGSFLDLHEFRFCTLVWCAAAMHCA